MAVVAQQQTFVGIAPACAALSVARATFYRWQTPTVKEPRPPRLIPRALPPDERTRVLALLNDARFADRAPAQVYATLLDEGTFLCSIPTMYRILRANRQVRERRHQRRHPSYHKPELLATRPNQVWSWDITKLLGPVKWTYFHLYVILDIFSRYVTGWMLAPRESSALAQRLIDETCATQGIIPGQLFLHADRGTSMTSKPVAWLLADLGVTRSHSRPQVSNDNPFSEAQFKTLKYRPEFPTRFGSIEDARVFCQTFFAWYNGEHRHAGIGLMTPAAVHDGRASAMRDARQRVLLTAYAAHPERFVRKTPQPPVLPHAVWINPPKKQSASQEGAGATISTVDDQWVGLNVEVLGVAPDSTGNLRHPVATPTDEVLH